MDPILTPQTVCELDTFTLQQQIELLQRQPDRALYLQVIRIAKLELIDRLEIEEFGRQLANDEYKLDFNFNLPLLPQKTCPTVQLAQSRQEFKVRASLITTPGRSFVTIGRPAVSHHYKPKAKPKEVEAGSKQKTFLRAKKRSYTNAKMKPLKSEMNTMKTSIGSKWEERKVIRGDQREEPKTAMTLEPKTVVMVEPKVVVLVEPKTVVKEEESLKEKLKRQCQQEEVVYRENDAYEDMKIIKMSPLNLKEEQAKLIQEEEEEEEKQKEKENEEEKQRQNEEEKQKEETYSQAEEPQWNKNQRTSNELRASEEEDGEGNSALDGCVQSETANPQSAAETHVDCQQMLKLNCTELALDQQVSRPAFYSEKDLQSALVIAAPSKPTPRNYKDPSSDCQVSALFTKKTSQTVHYHQSPTELPLVLEPLYKESKSKSVKLLTRKDPLPAKSEHDPCEIITSKLRKSIACNGSPSLESTQIFDAKARASKSKFKPSRFQTLLKPLKVSQPVLPYSQQIPSFQRLFPHSKNLLVTLRNVEASLRLHFERRVNSRSISDEARRLTSEAELPFKIISECDKAEKHREYFNISLESFFRRSGLMLDRIKNEMDEPEPEEMLFFRVVRTKEEVYDIVNSSFHRTRHWYELPHGLELKNSWNLLWTWSRPQIDFTDLLIFQKVNHFLGNKQLARKDLLKKNIEKVQRLGSRMRQFFDIIPETFLLPGENIPFIKKFRADGQKDPLNYWILKPVGLSRGRGISLVNRLEDVTFSEPIILQKYLSNPLLIDGFKFDMRIYVLVTSINPLQAFIYREGFARLSTQPYSLSRDKIDNKFIHLTNFSIQRQALPPGPRHSLEEEVGGSKISLRMLALKLKGMGVEWGAVERQIEDIVLKSLIACMNVIPANPNCFQLFGYDIFLDQNGKCWLLEVNSSPSLEKEFTLDQIIKQQLVDDIVEVVSPLNYDRQRLLKVVEARRKEAEGLKSAISTSSNSVAQLNEDLAFILHGQKMRGYGEGAGCSNFKMIAPSDCYHRIVKVLQQYKIDSIIRKDT